MYTFELASTLTRLSGGWSNHCLGAVDFLLGNPTKARSILGWELTVSFDGLVKLMVREDLKEAERSQLCGSAEFRTYNQFE